MIIRLQNNVTLGKKCYNITCFASARGLLVTLAVNLTIPLFPMPWHSFIYIYIYIFTTTYFFFMKDIYLKTNFGNNGKIAHF